MVYLSDWFPGALIVVWCWCWLPDWRLGVAGFVFVVLCFDLFLGFGCDCGVCPVVCRGRISGGWVWVLWVFVAFWV